MAKGNEVISLKPFFCYYGGKYRIARRYPRPRWGTIVEPFAGAAGYSTRYPTRKVFLYEVNQKVYATWEYLINASSKEIYHLPLVFDDVRDLDICQEAKWVIGWWLNKGSSQPCNIPGKWMREGTRPNSFWGETIRQRLANQVGSIRHWKVYNSSYENASLENATWFIDPPYQRSGTRYMNSQIDYKRLRCWVRSLPGQVIACGQEGDNWLPFRPFINTRSLEGYGRVAISKEMVWTKDCR